MFQTKIVGKINKYILCSVTFFRKSCLLSDDTVKYCSVRQATDDKMEHAHCMLDNKGYTHTHSQYVILIGFHCNNGCTNGSDRYVHTYIATLTEADMSALIFLHETQETKRNL